MKKKFSQGAHGFEPEEHAAQGVKIKALKDDNNNTDPRTWSVEDQLDLLLTLADL